ncbi:MAG: type IV secretion protein Rhs [Dehalococcoidia bacterium]
MAGWWGPPKPSGQDRELQQIINQLYRPGAALGNGGTADVIRAGAGHVQKGAERIAQLNRWLIHNPSANRSDVDTAQSLLQDLVAAMTGNGYPGP